MAPLAAGPSVVVAGPVGVGKSRLVAEVLDRAEVADRGGEVHDLAIFRRRPGDATPVADLAARAPERLAGWLTLVNGSGPVLPGARSYVVATPGAYVALDLVAVGTRDLRDILPDGTPHYRAGMWAGFTVPPVPALTPPGAGGGGG